MCCFHSLASLTHENTGTYTNLKHGLYETISPLGNNGTHWHHGIYSQYGIQCQVLITCHLWDFFLVQDVKSLDVSFLSRYTDKMTNYAWLSLGWKVYMFFVNWQAVWISVWGVFHVWCLNNVNRMRAYAERCQTVISEKGSALGPGTRLDHSRASVLQSFIKVKRRQTKLLTQISEGRRRVPTSLVLEKGAIYFFNWLSR